MSKIITIALSFLLLLQSSNIHLMDIAQIDEFIEHAQFHKEQYGDNLFVFISKHYGNLKEDHNRQHQEERSDHEKLPFDHNCQQVTTSTAFVLTLFDSFLKTTDFKDSSEANFHYQDASSSLHSSSILQPPQFS